MQRLYKWWIVAEITLLALLEGESGYSYNFAESTPLSSGKWVKVEIDSTALYEIPYSILEEMGFQNPSKVGVYGKGGRMFSMNFISADGNEPYSDKLSPVPVMHENDKLYFYGEGVESIEFSPNQQGRYNFYKRNPLNIYSSAAYYFLTDKDESPLLAESRNLPDDMESVSSGFGYIYHEVDKEQNSTGTGQLFWGESLANEPEKTWEIATPYRMAGSASFDFSCYQSYSSKSEIEYGIDRMFKSTASLSTTSSKKFVEKAFQYDFEMDEATTTGVRIKSLSTTSSFLNIDYWLLSYPKRFPKAEDNVVSELYSFATEAGKCYKLSLPEHLSVLDITNPREMHEAVPADKDMLLSAIGGYMSVLVYDKRQAQRAIIGWKPVEPTNLHSLAAEGADLLIITVPRFRNYAEQLAQLHSRIDGIKSIVTTPEELYNEFSGGVPDPMAYRAYAKMLKESVGVPLKNILLFGPSAGNNRYYVQGETEFDRILAFQEIEATMEREASAIYDFYGITADLINTNYIYRETMDVGVGILSCETDVECERIIEKIKGYMEDETHASWLGNSLVIGGDGDSHTHENQASDFKTYIRKYAIAPLCTSVIAVDAYGYKGAREQFISKLNEGESLTVYFGHGSKKMFGKNTEFFTSGEAMLLKNKPLGFAYLGGCDFSVPDMRMRGLGEVLVLDSPGGMIGTVISTRSTWSNQNYDFGMRLVNNWYNAEFYDSVPTIGEIYAKAKSGSEYSNSTCYVLASDPALKVPAPRRTVKFDDASLMSDMIPGGMAQIKGMVSLKDGTEDTRFNGKVVLKIMEPAVELCSADYVTNEIQKGDTLRIMYDTSLIKMYEGEVNNGRIELNVPVPSSLKSYAGKVLPVYVTCYDADRSYGAAGFLSLTVSENEISAEDKDTEAPVIECRYEIGGNRLIIAVSDNRALDTRGSGIKVKVDGFESKFIHQNSAFADMEGTDCYGYTDLSGLPFGKHAITISAVDTEGNESIEETEVEVIKNAAPLQLHLATLAVTDRLDAEIENLTGESLPALEYFIFDYTGNKISSGEVNNDIFSWNCKNLLETMVSPGLYKVMVAAPGTERGRFYSNWVYFAILE